MRLLFVATLATFSLLSGCAAKEVLVGKSAVVPAGVDMSGRWQLRAGSQDTIDRIKEAEIAAAGGEQQIILTSRQKKRNSRSRPAAGASVHVFLETGGMLKITQTDFGLFISFDRAIVEEYRFGERREVSVGPIVADRVSGWQGQSYVIETLDEEGAKLVETYRLGQDAASLIRTISILDDGVSQMTVEQIFDRI